MATVMRCEPCGKSFTGPTSYKQHLASEKHKKKFLRFGLLNDSDKRDVQTARTAQKNPLSVFECLLCKAAFDTFMDFRIHSDSLEHAQKVIEKNSSKISDVSNSSGTINSKNNASDLSVFDDEKDKILPINDMYKSQALSFAACSTSAVNSTATFSCDPCKQIFSSSVPYIKKYHIKKDTSEVVVYGSKKPRLEDCSFEDKSQNIQWFCYTCKVQCNGQISFEQHLAGITHMKNVNKAQIEKSYFKSEDFIQLASKNNIDEYKILNACHFVNGTNGNMNTDAGIPVMSLKELEKSIKIFLPHEEINFDKYKMDDEMDTADENIPNASEEIQNEVHESRINQDCYESNACVNLKDDKDEIEEKSGVHSFCDLSNVNLTSTEAAQSHFKNLEYYKKNWKSI